MLEQTVRLHDLPRRQRDVLEFIIENILTKDQSPTEKEISDGLKIAPAQVHQILIALEEKKKISRQYHKSRSIVVI